MLKKLASFIPGTNEYKERTKTQKEQDLFESLYLLRDSFDNAFRYDEVFELFERILNNPSVSIVNKSIIDKNTKVSFLTRTSHKALDLVNRQVYDMDSIKRMGDHISFSGDSRPYIYWESNRDSVLLFYSFMKEMIHKAVLLEGSVEHSKLEQNAITSDEETFINSILFRYLCSDLIQLLIVYMEESNETTEDSKTTKQ